METMNLKAEMRTLIGRATNDLRADNTIPAVIYGAGETPINIQVTRSDFDRMYTQAGESTVVQINIDGKDIPVLIHALQYDPKTDFTIHVDFLRVDMTKTVEASIEIVLTGESAAVNILGGTLLQNAEEVEVRALPAALVRQIEVDIAKLATFDDAIYASDLVMPEGIEMLSEGELLIALVQAPRNEAEMAELDAPVDVNVDAVEVTKEKKEAEEAAAAAEGKGESKK